MILQNGTMIADKYRVISLLGSGGMGTVYRVTHTHLHKDFALKIIDVHNHSEQAVRRFHFEAKTTAQLKHPNLVAVQDFGIYNDTQPYLVMDLIQGQTLTSVLKKKGALPVDYVVPLAIELARGLNYAHSVGVVHRDIKPGNIIVLKPDQRPSSGCVKIVDFGIAKLVQSEEGQMQELTRTGEIFGSPIYMSPEQCQGNVIDERTDIYSLGCVLFECLTGSPPFLADNAMTTMAKRLTSEPESLKDGSLGIEFPQPIEDIIHKMLILDPRQRYQSLDSVIEDLSNYEKGDSKHNFRSVVTSNNDAARNSRRSKFIDFGLVVATFVVFAVATHYLDLRYSLHIVDNSQTAPQGHVPLTVQEKVAAKEKIQLNAGLGDHARPPTLTIDTTNSDLQTINFPDYSGHYCVYPSTQQLPAVGPVPTSRQRPIGLAMSESAASNPEFLKNLSDAYFDTVNFCGAFLVNNTSLVQVANLKHFSGLNLVNCTGVTSLANIVKVPMLSALFLQGTNVTSNDILALPYLRQLNGFGFGPLSDPDVILNVVLPGNNLERLDYQGPGVEPRRDDALELRGLNASDLRLLAEAKSIVDLRFKNCPQINDRTLGIILAKKGNPLKILVFDNCNITSASIPLLAKYRWGHLEIASNSWTKADRARFKETIPNAHFQKLAQSTMMQLMKPGSTQETNALKQLF